MSEYTHRNGETEPPTVFGPYWMSVGDDELGGKSPILRIVKVYGRAGTQQIFVDLLVDDSTPIEETHARWWGPIPRPQVSSA